MANHLEEKTFTSDRYYELRHELESDFHEDYDFSNAVAYGEISSVNVCDKNTLQIETTHYYDDGESAPYRVTICYLDDGEYGPQHSKSNEIYRGYWFNQIPDNGLDHISFDNCVFEADVDINNLKGVSFQNCFFLKGVSIEGKDCGVVRFEQCYFGENLDIHDLETDDLFIRNCNINRTFTISNCKIRKWTSVYRDYVKLGMHLMESFFLGNECLFENIKTGYELESYNCTFEAPVEITSCLIESLDVEGSNFNTLDMDSVVTHKYIPFEELSNSSNESSDHIQLIGVDDESLANDPDICRINKFQNAISEALDRKSAIKFVRTLFNERVTISNVTSTLMIIGGCRACDEFTIMSLGDEHNYIERSGPVQTMILNQKEQDHELQILDLSGTIFYEDVEIQNVYRFIDLSDTKFKDHSDIDEEYLEVTKGWPVKTINKETRLIDYSTHTLQELLVSCNRDDFERREKLYLDVKTQERNECNSLFKVGYVAHELLSNYGKSPLRVLFVIAAIIGLFTLLFYGAGHDTLANCTLDSCSSFFTIGLGVSNITDYAVKSLVVLEGALGFTLMTYFVVVLCDRRKLS